jgi:hypothetical protein
MRPGASARAHAPFVALPLIVACSGGAGKEPFELRTEVASNAQTPFENALGWRVQVEGAWLSVGSLRLLEGAPLSLRNTERGAWWSEWLVGTAHAHPGHFQEGDVVAEMLTPQSVDLGVVTQLAPSSALDEEAHSGKITFQSPPAAPHPAALGGQVLRVVGRAERTTEEGVTLTRHFVADAGPEDVASGPTTGATASEITGCPFSGERLAAGGTLRLEVDVALWLHQVDFESVASGAPESPTPLSEEPRASNGFLRGVRKASAYRFRFLEGSSP